MKVIDMKFDYPIETARCMMKNFDFNPSNATMISWAKGRIKNIKRSIRRVNKSIKSIKTRKPKANKIDTGHKIPMMT